MAAIQIIFAGKAHPAADPGKQIIQRIFNAARNPETGGRIAFKVTAIPFNFPLGILDRVC